MVELENEEMPVKRLQLLRGATSQLSTPEMLKDRAASVQFRRSKIREEEEESKDCLNITAPDLVLRNRQRDSSSKLIPPPKFTKKYTPYTLFREQSRSRYKPQ